jgi:cell division septation protein DedD
VLQDLNFLVAPKRETLIVESAAERQMNAPSGPRVIAPELPEEDIVFSEALMPIESEEFLPAVNTPSPEAVSEDLGPDIITEPAEDPIVNDQQETGSWHVQFGAFGVDSNARLRWDQIQSSGLLLDNQAPRFEDAGNLTRLLTDIGTTEDRARTLCAQVKSANLGDCLARQIVE